MTGPISPMVAVLRPDVSEWLLSLAQVKNDPILDEMHQLARQRGFPIIGPEVGRLLAQVATLIGAKRVFELGSGFGYSTLWFARAVGEGGHVFHTDGDPKNTELARDFLGRAGVGDRVTLLNGDARELIDQTPGEFDIILCDIDKHQYPSAYEKMKGRVRVGGAIMVDNLVWSGKIASGVNDAPTNGGREYLKLMWNDPNFLSSLMPVRDGLGLSVRIA